MNIKLKIALRYIFPRGNFNFISIITIISIIGISLGVAALIIVMSIFNGFRAMSEDAILDVDPAVRIISKKNHYFIPDSTFIKQIKHLPNVHKIIPILQTKAVIINDDKIEVIELISNTHNLLDEKSFILGTNLHNNDGVVLGFALKERLNANILDTMKLISMASLKNAINSLQLPAGIDVVTDGIIYIDIKNYDLTNCYVNYDIVRKIAGKISNNSVTQIDIFSTKNDEKTTSKLATDIAKILPKDYKIQTWIDLNKDLYNIMQMERMAVFCVISLILLIAIFNVFASLAMTVMEKKKEILLLKALGTKNSMLTHIYIIEGILIGSIGTIIGLIIGLGIVYGQINFAWIKLNSAAYIVSALPIKLNHLEVIIVCIFSLLLSVVAAYFPAKSATKQINKIRLNNE